MKTKRLTPRNVAPVKRQNLGNTSTIFSQIITPSIEGYGDITGKYGSKYPFADDSLE